MRRREQRDADRRRAPTCIRKCVALRSHGFFRALPSLACSGDRRARSCDIGTSPQPSWIREHDRRARKAMPALAALHRLGRPWTRTFEYRLGAHSDVTARPRAAPELRGPLIDLGHSEPSRFRDARWRVRVLRDEFVRSPPLWWKARSVGSPLRHAYLETLPPRIRQERERTKETRASVEASSDHTRASQAHAMSAAIDETRTECEEHHVDRNPKLFRGDLAMHEFAEPHRQDEEGREQKGAL